MNDPYDWIMASCFVGSGEIPKLKTYLWPYIISAKITHNQATLSHKNRKSSHSAPSLSFFTSLFPQLQSLIRDYVLLVSQPSHFIAAHLLFSLVTLSSFFDFKLHGTRRKWLLTVATEAPCLV